jgi:pimeloyl-ACP methyl ester carboxylesterase
MRFPGLPRLLAAAFRLGVVRRRFVARHFLKEHPREFIDAFFAGYHDAGAFASWFDWLRPGLLRRLEGEIARSPAALEGVEAWWGGRDHVVTVEELRHTERALGVSVPLRVFPQWGHYPMIDDPEGWVAEVERVVAAPRDVS